MISAHDVAAYILKERGPLPAMKLHKLVYYSQAWSLVWDERPLFAEAVEAWAHGPAVPELYNRHRGTFKLDTWPWGNPDALDDDARETVNAVMDYYGPQSVQWLSDLTHREAPWLEAREGIPDGERGSSAISLATMAEYYASLP